MRRLAAFAYAFAFGILAYQYLLSPETILWGGAVAAALLLAGLLARKELRGRLLIAACAVAAGVAWSGLWDLWRVEPLGRWSGSLVTATVEVTDYAEAAGSGGLRIPVVLREEGLPRCAAMYYGEEGLEDLAPGDRVTGDFYLQEAGEIGGDRVDTFTARGIFLLLYDQGEVRVTEGDSPLRYLPQRLARRMGELIGALYDQRSAPFMEAMILGDRGDFTEARTSQLSQAGLLHITAVSGLHCGFLLNTVSVLVGKHRRRILAAVAIPILLLYMLVVGCTASVVRATVIQILCLLAPLLRRPEDRLTSLGAAMALLLLWNPMAITGVGFQLTFASMFGILCLSPRLCALLVGESRNRLWRGVASGLAASLGATAMTAPLCAVHFNYLVLISPLTNLLTIPVAGLTFASGVLSLALGAAVPALGAVIGFPAHVGALWIQWVAETLAAIPYHAVYFTNPYLIYWMGYVLLLFLYCALTPKKGRRKYLTASALSAGTLAFLLGLPARSVAYGSLHVVAVDVGQGASTILASDGAAALVDCGSSNSFVDAGNAAADTLAAYGYHSLDYVALTHYHEDHADGLEVLLARTPVGCLLLPALEGEDDLHREVVELAAAYDVPIRYVREETEYPLGEGTLRIYPPLGEEETNEAGLTVLASSGGFDVLITGDMDDDTERKLVETYDLPDIEVLMVGHHGSKYSTSYELLLDTFPEVGIISVGRNSYGHPTEEAMQRMARCGMTLYRTDLQGNISITVK